MVNVNDKYLDILNSTRSLIWKFGIKRVTVEEICREAGSSRVTFYKYFENKEDVVLAVVKELVETNLGLYREILEADKPYTEKVKDLIQLKMQQSDQLSSDLIRDLYSPESGKVYEYFSKATVSNLKTIEQDFRKAQEEGDLRQEIRIEFILYFLNKLIEMSTDDYLLTIYKTPGELISELTRFFFYGVIPRPGGDENK